VALGKLPEAWNAFQQAYEINPNSADSKAMLRYGIRVAGLPLREAVPPNSSLFGKNLGENLTRDHATFTISSTASDEARNHASLFKGAYAKSGFAFHTDKEKGAHIIIDLKANCSINALRITNRNNIHERAATLTVWTSTDQKSWTTRWAADKVAPVWDILLPSPVKAQYIKVGLAPEKTENLHLRAVDAFGIRP
jgi:hypothetical protein